MDTAENAAEYEVRQSLHKHQQEINRPQIIHDTKGRQTVEVDQKSSSGHWKLENGSKKRVLLFVFVIFVPSTYRLHHKN